MKNDSSLDKGESSTFGQSKKGDDIKSLTVSDIDQKTFGADESQSNDQAIKNIDGYNTMRSDMTFLPKEDRPEK